MTEKQCSHKQYFSKRAVVYMGLDARKPVFGGLVNNKGTDQPAHLSHLMSAFVIDFLNSIISYLATSEI